MRSPINPLTDYAHGMRCPYCGATVALHWVTNDVCPDDKIMYWACDNQSCAASVDCVADTDQPLGVLHNHKMDATLAALSDLMELIVINGNVSRHNAAVLLVDTIRAELLAGA